MKSALLINMRKEVLVAIILGVGLGAIVAFGVWRANSILSPKVKQAMQTPINNASNTNQPSNGNSVSDLILTQPEDNLVVSKDKLTIKGSASPNSTVVIISSEDQIITESQNDGTFEEEVLLASGLNEVQVLSYDDKGNESKKSLNVVYSTEFPGTN